MRRLSRLLSRSSATEIESTILESSTTLDRPLLLNLPIEILLNIELYLQYENVLAFSLTCKKAYELFFRRHKPSGKHNGREFLFLRLLERELPAYVSCSIHERLYAWAKQKSKHYQCPLCNSNKRILNGSFVVCNKGCKSSFYGIFESERRLMLRHAILGSDFGITTRTLDHVCKKSFSKRANEVTPKIVNHSLLVWRTHHYATKINFRDWHTIGIDQFDEAVCVHSETGLRALLCAAILHAKQSSADMIPSRTPKAPTPTFGSWVCPILFKCNQCCTDVRLSMDQVSVNEIIVRFDVFQDLGGLQELTLAQRQVLGAKFDWRAQQLDYPEKLQRLCEDLEKRYYGEDSEDNSISHSTVSIPKDAYFLNQWTYNIQPPPFDLENPVNFHHDPMIPQEVWRGTNTIPFILRDHGLLDSSRPW